MSVLANGKLYIATSAGKGWGAKTIDKLSVDVKKEFPALKGFSPRNLFYMKEFAQVYSIPILQQFIEKERNEKA